MLYFCHGQIPLVIPLPDYLTMIQCSTKIFFSLSFLVQCSLLWWPVQADFPTTNYLQFLLLLSAFNFNDIILTTLQQWNMVPISVAMQQCNEQAHGWMNSQSRQQRRARRSQQPVRCSFSKSLTNSSLRATQITTNIWHGHQYSQQQAEMRYQSL